MRAFIIVVVFVLLISSVSFMNLLGGEIPEGFNISDDAIMFGSKHDNVAYGHEEYGGPYIAFFTSFRLLLGDFDPTAYLDETRHGASNHKT